MTIRVSPQWGLDLTPNRQCGSCYACCVWLGITELKKWTGQTCRHLNGTTDPAKRCSIYATRPKACSTYQCMWREGFGPEWLRPSQSGILLTTYQLEGAKPPDSPGALPPVGITAIVFQSPPNMTEILHELMALPIPEIRVVWPASRKVLLFKKGSIFEGKLLPGDSYESLRFEAPETPIGHYKVLPEGTST